MAEGQVEVMTDLEGVQGQHFDQPLVVVADRLTGNEDIPEVGGRGGVATVGASQSEYLVCSWWRPAGLSKTSRRWSEGRGKEGAMLFWRCVNIS